jgi:hypothetical protein
MELLDTGRSLFAWFALTCSCSLSLLWCLRGVIAFVTNLSVAVAVVAPSLSDPPLSLLLLSLFFCFFASLASFSSLVSLASPKSLDPCLIRLPLLLFFAGSSRLLMLMLLPLPLPLPLLLYDGLLVLL